MSFNERKVAQEAAHFLLRAPDRRLHKVKLMKLLYLADRRNIKLYGCSISGDRAYSMKHGPILTVTLNVMNGESDGPWESWVTTLEDHMYELGSAVDTERSDELSRADVAILDDVWNEYGGVEVWPLVERLHVELAEWTSPGHSSIPIPFAEIARSVGLTGDEIRLIEDEQRNYESARRSLVAI